LDDSDSLSTASFVLFVESLLDVEDVLESNEFVTEQNTYIFFQNKKLKLSIRKEIRRK